MKLRNINLTLLLFCFVCSCSEQQAQLKPLADDAVILAFGDSLTYGTGVNSTTQSYPAVLAALTGLTVIRRGIPGEISALGLKRLPDALAEIQPDLVILCHGGNDLIRRLDHTQLKNNLNQMINLSKESGAQVLLIAVPNFSLTLNVPQLYSQLAEEHDIPIELDVLRDIESDPALKSDQVHPNVKGYKLMAERIYKLLDETNGLKLGIEFQNSQKK